MSKSRTPFPPRVGLLPEGPPHGPGAEPSDQPKALLRRGDRTAGDPGGEPVPAERKRFPAWPGFLRSAAVSGSFASLASLAALVFLGQRDCASAFAPVNAISHWVWRDRALRQQDASLRYTVPGYLIHHAMSILWAVLFEAGARAPSPWTGVARLVGTGLTVAGVACFVDLRCTPERLTPGFERRLRPESLAVVYVAFGVGLALPWVWSRLQSR